MASLSSDKWLASKLGWVVLIEGIVRQRSGGVLGRTSSGSFAASGEEAVHNRGLLD